jgi:hypothetical protein
MTPTPRIVPADTTNPCLLPTTHLLTVGHDHPAVCGLTLEEDAEAIGWGWTPTTVVLPAHCEGNVTDPDPYYPGEPEAVIGGCDDPNGEHWGFDPDTCSGRCFWLDNQGSYVCEAHVLAVEEVTP